MAQFDPRRPYDPHFELRDWSGLAGRIASQKPHGVLWPLVGTRRMGKTWATRALARAITEDHAASGLTAERLDLGDEDDRRRFHSADDLAAVLLLDEPSRAIDQEAARFLDRCAELKKRGARILLALTPRELAHLREADGGRGRVRERDLEFLEPLTVKQAESAAARADWSATLLEQLPPDWRRKPFVLELVLSVAESDSELRAPARVKELLEAVGVRSQAAEHFYWKAAFLQSLTDRQQHLLRAVAGHIPPRGAGSDDEDRDALERIGVLARAGPGTSKSDELRIADPLLALHLPPPLRIHHISDVHVGPKSAGARDVKASDAAGKLFGSATAARHVRDAYVEHLRELRRLGRAPHVVMVSGDLAETARLAEEFEPAREWLEQVEAIVTDVSHDMLTLDDPRVLVVGGNHDVDWTKSLGEADSRERHDAFAKVFGSYPRPQLERPPEQRPVARVDYRGPGVSVALLGSAEFGGEPIPHDPETARLLERINELGKEATDAMSKDDGERAAGILSRIARVDPGLVHDRDLQRLRGAPWSAPVRIAVLHHPVSPLPTDAEVASYAGLLNAGRVKDALFNCRFALVLHGHLHVGWFGEETWPGRHREHVLRIASAPSLGSREVSEKHGFNEILITCEGSEEYRITVNRFVRSGSTWSREATMGPFEPGARGAGPSGADRDP